MTYDKVVVTGGAGLIGSHIVDLLVDGRDGHDGEIVVLDNIDTRAAARTSPKRWRRRSAHASSRVTSATDASQCAMRSTAPTLVFHQAAIRITHCAEDPRLAVDVLVNGTFNVRRGRGRSRG